MPGSLQGEPHQPPAWPSAPQEVGGGGRGGNAGGQGWGGHLRPPGPSSPCFPGSGVPGIKGTPHLPASRGAWLGSSTKYPERSPAAPAGVSGSPGQSVTDQLLKLDTWAGSAPGRQRRSWGGPGLLQGLPLGGGSGQQHWGLGASGGLPPLPGRAEVHVCRARAGTQTPDQSGASPGAGGPGPLRLRSQGGPGWVRGSCAPHLPFPSPAGMTPAREAGPRGTPAPPAAPAPLGKQSRMGCSRAYLSRL